MESFIWTAIALGVGLVFVLLFGLFVKAAANREEPTDGYNNVQQDLCDERQSLLTRGLGRPSKSMKPAEWAAYRQLLAESDELAKNKQKGNYYER